MYLFNTLSGQKERFTSIKPNHVKMYVCGPTVYDVPHIGNARSAVVYDVLYRVLCHLYDEVIYVRNITDVDDKIIDKCKITGLNQLELSSLFADIYKNNIRYLNCLDPTFEPKVSDNIDNIIRMIIALINNGHAYNIDGNVYFDVSTYRNYGSLSHKNLEELYHGVRIDIETDKKNPADFVLWKKSEDVCFWPSPWGNGRPGWHIECSAMIDQYLGKNFDIHGGGVDLKFPHHENEIAQSVCANQESSFANFWIHNGFVMLNDQKMSKSLGNIMTVDQLIESDIKGEIIRYVLMQIHYRKPLNWNESILEQAAIIMNNMYNAIDDFTSDLPLDIDQEFLTAISDDLNIPLGLSILQGIVGDINHIKQKLTSDSSDMIELLNKKINLQCKLKSSANIIGLLTKTYKEWIGHIDEQEIELLIQKRNIAKRDKNYQLADRIREQLLAMGVKIMDNKDGTTTWKV